MVTRYVHVLYQISRVSRFWVRAKSAAANCPTKMGADCRRGGVISRTRGYMPHRAGAVDCPNANNYTLVQESANIMFYIILNIMKKRKL